MRALALLLLAAVAELHAGAINNRQSAWCAPLRLQHGRVRSRLRAKIVRFSCQFGYELVGNKYATCDGTNWDVPTPVCVRPGCPDLRQLEHGISVLSHKGAYASFYCSPGYQLTGSSAINCDGVRWNTTRPVCVDVMTTPELSCDFEGFKDPWCGWRDDEFHDFDWRRYSKKAPSSFMKTGPSHDHTLGPGQAGHYLYVESSGRTENETARIISPIYEAGLARTACFSFYYHMFGKTTGTLRVYQKPVSLDLNTMLAEPSTGEWSAEGAETPRYRLFELTGNQGDHWHRAVVDLYDFREDFQVVVEGVRGSSFTSDIALDDVVLLPDRDTCVRARANISSVSPSAATVVLDSCAGRCGSEQLFSELGDTFECACVYVCVLDNSCCADFRDICVFSGAEEATTTTDEEEVAVDWKPQTMKLVASSLSQTSYTPMYPSHLPRSTFVHLRVTTESINTTSPPTPTTTARTTKLAATTTTNTPIYTTATSTTMHSTKKVTTSSPLPPITTRPTPPITAPSSSSTTNPTLPKVTITTEPPHPVTRSSTTSSTTTTIFASTERSVTKQTTAKLLITTRAPTTMAHSNRTESASTSRAPLENHYEHDIRAQHHDGGGASAVAVVVWFVGVASLLAAGVAAVRLLWRRSRWGRVGRAFADEVRYLTQDDHLDIDAAD